MRSLGVLCQSVELKAVHVTLLLTFFMTQPVLAIGQILSDASLGLLPFLDQLFETTEFASFRTQFHLIAEDATTQLKNHDDTQSLQTTLTVCLKSTIVLEQHSPLETAVQLAVEFQSLLDAALVQWSQLHPMLLSPVTQLSGSFASVDEVPYRGAYLPGFAINRSFKLTYRLALASVDKANASMGESVLYSPGELTPQSGQYEIINPGGQTTGLEVTSTQGNPLPPTAEANQLYKLVDPTKHKTRL